MHRFYDSPVRTVGLKKIQSILGASDLRLKGAGNTRWLSHDQAITAIRKSLPSIITSLQKEMMPKHWVSGNSFAHISLLPVYT